MIKNNSTLLKENLLALNPFLHEIAVTPFSTSGYSIKDLSDFIEGCWNKYYSEPLRIKFTPEFLKFLGMRESPENFALVAKHNGKLVGTIIAIPHQYAINGKQLNSFMVTGLTVDASMRGERVSQLLNHCLYEKLIDAGFDLALFWLDNRLTQQGSSFQIYKKENKKIHATFIKKIYGKLLDKENPLNRRKPSTTGKILLKLVDVLFPLNPKHPEDMEVVAFSPSLLEEIVSFLEHCQRSGPIKKVFLKENLLRQLAFFQGSCRTVAFFLRKNGSIKGAIFGVTIADGNTRPYLQVDGLFFDPGLRYKDRKAFISAYEARALEDFGCSAIIIPAPVACELMGKFGYLPVSTQVLGTYFCSNRIDKDESLVADIFAELR